MDSNEQLSIIKKAGETDRISKEEFEERIREIARCKRDIVYFAEKYFRIINLDTGLTLIKLYPKQKELLRFFANERRCITLAARQTGKTTTYTIYALWTLMFQCEKKIMLLANKADTALEILGRIKMAYEYLPPWLKPGVVVLNKGEIIFSNKSAIKGFATASDAARGYSANIVICDEFSFVPNNIASKVFESIYPVLSSSKNSTMILVSTPNGADPNNLYYSIWQKANRKESDKNAEGWKAFRIDWFDVPGRDEQWKNNTIASIGARRFAQEFGNEFLSNASTKKLIDEDIIEKFRMKLSEYKIKNVKPKTQRIISEKQDRLYEFQMWHEFDKDRTYVASGDIAEGVGGDASVLQVWDVTDTKNITLVAKFSSNRVSLVEFAYVCSKILPLYGNPYLFAERNGLSAGMIDALRITYQYPNIACESKNGEAGIYSHVSVKIKACLWARDMLTTDGFGFRIYDKELIDEMSTFVKKDGKSDKTMYAAISPAHDDNIMSFVWMCYSLQNDVVDKYYVLVDTFKSVFDRFHPARLAPLAAYTSDTLKRISNDPIYRDFMDFKEQNMSECMKLMQAEERENRNDVFKYS